MNGQAVRVCGGQTSMHVRRASGPVASRNTKARRLLDTAGSRAVERTVPGRRMPATPIDVPSCLMLE
jgi:hypothetical protein